MSYFYTPIPRLFPCPTILLESVQVARLENRTREEAIQEKELWAQDPHMVEAIVEWFRGSLSLPDDFKSFDIIEAIDIFHKVQVVLGGSSEGVDSILLKAQTDMTGRLSGQSRTRVQRNVVQRYHNLNADEEVSDSDSVSSDFDDNDDPSDVYQPPSDEDTAAVDSDISMEDDDQNSGTDDMDADPVLVSMRKRCRSWVEKLQQVFFLEHSDLSDSKVTAFIDHADLKGKRAVVAVTIQEMREVPPRIYNDPMWSKAVKMSTLTKIIAKICNPQYLVAHPDPHSEAIFRFHAVQESLGLILQNWTPNDIVQTWQEKDRIFKPKPFVPNTEWLTDKQREEMEIRNQGAKLLRALKRHPNLIPRVSNPSAVFFLLSFNCFEVSWNRWLGRRLETLGYNISETNPDKLFTSTKRELSGKYKAHPGMSIMSFEKNVSPELGLILDRTQQYSDRKNCFDEFLHENQPKKSDGTRKILNMPLIACAKCAGLPHDEQCVQLFRVCHQTYDANVAGCGVTLAADGQCMDPVIPKPADGEAPQVPTRILHPDDLDMRPLRSDPKILERCHRHIWLVVQDLDEYEQLRQQSPTAIDPFEVADIIYVYKGQPFRRDSAKKDLVMAAEKDPDTRKYKLVDFVFYGAFSPEVVGYMEEHLRSMMSLKPLRRGRAFNFWTAGRMIPSGSRQPSGGAKGDAYTLYVGMTAENIDGMYLLFNCAEDDLFLSLATQFAYPLLFKHMEDITLEVDKLGRSGTNVFYCEGYCAPLHDDRDASRGVCSQISWDADPDICAFSFCQPQWGYYIVTESNMLWSFNSGDMHGTMLPSNQEWHPAKSAARPDGELNSRRAAMSSVGTSTGNHKTVPLRNLQRAKQYARVRNTYSDRSAYWAQE